MLVSALAVREATPARTPADYLSLLPTVDPAPPRHTTGFASRLLRTSARGATCVRFAPVRLLVRLPRAGGTDDAVTGFVSRGNAGATASLAGLFSMWFCAMAHLS